ncbi:MAG TPA: DNA-processing protein DprA [Streptosporangiaceae bacterium]|nr:DNA-processing protein DprA [Streptosporangiaceae bacterium]
MSASDDQRLARATLCAIAEPGNALLGALVARLGPLGALEAVRAGAPPHDLVTGDQARSRLAEHLASWRIRLTAADPVADLTVCDRLGGRLICPGDAEWPTQLDDLGAARPHALWLRGPGDLRYGCLRSVALVGARAASSYGVRIAADLAADLCERGWTVVSGGAMGVDAAAHRGALAADGDTVAVFANGVDAPYPSRNDGLFAEMARRALLVSETPPGTHPTRSRFLVRNRVIAALTRGTVVIEAAARSGALNTAAHARKLGRAVMAIPGPITSRTSIGCHKLLRDTPPARCVTNAAEILEEVGQFGADLAPEPRGPIHPRDGLEATTRQVLEAIPARGGAGPAQIAVKAGVDLNTTRSRLGILAAAGFIERCDQGWRLPRPRKSGPRPSDS